MMLPEFCQVNQSSQWHVTLERYSKQHRGKSLKIVQCNITLRLLATSSEIANKIRLNCRKHLGKPALKLPVLVPHYFSLSALGLISQHCVERG